MNTNKAVALVQQLSSTQIERKLTIKNPFTAIGRANLRLLAAKNNMSDAFYKSSMHMNPDEVKKLNLKDIVEAKSRINNAFKIDLNIVVDHIKQSGEKFSLQGFDNSTAKLALERMKRKNSGNVIINALETIGANIQRPKVQNAITKVAEELSKALKITDSNTKRTVKEAVELYHNKAEFIKELLKLSK